MKRILVVLGLAVAPAVCLASDYTLESGIIGGSSSSSTSYSVDSVIGTEGVATTEASSASYSVTPVNGTEAVVPVTLSMFDLS